MLRATLRHLVAVTVSVTWPPIAAAVAYLVLLGVAIITDTGLGGPLALPAMLFAALAFGVAATLCVILPAVAAAEALAARGGWRLFWQIPLSTLIAGALWLVWAGLASRLEGLRGVGVARIAWCGLALTLVPLGIYWWTARAADWLMILLERLVDRVRGRREPPTGRGSSGRGDGNA